MSIAYCPCHERLFDPKRNAWINWSRMYIDMVEHLCDMLDAEHIECSEYKVIQTFCDCCTNVARQAVYEQIEPLQ
jgi:hypothetical protein